MAAVLVTVSHMPSKKYLTVLTNNSKKVKQLRVVCAQLLIGLWAKAG